LGLLQLTRWGKSGWGLLQDRCKSGWVILEIHAIGTWRLKGNCNCGWGLQDVRLATDTCSSNLDGLALSGWFGNVRMVWQCHDGLALSGWFWQCHDGLALSGWFGNVMMVWHYQDGFALSGWFSIVRMVSDYQDGLA